MRNASTVGDWQALRVSQCRTYHEDDHSQPAYEERFSTVLSFHPPGLAPASRDGQWFLIDARGMPTSERTWRRVAGFYDGLCAVESESGWTHIDESLKETYDHRWIWAGNFQQGRCTVQDHGGAFYHIDPSGERISGPWTYAGDFREGFAAVRTLDGWATHIDRQGNRAHDKQFFEAREYHKGWAVVRDELGWFHVDSSGRTRGTQRYAYLEPFYNGRAYGQHVDGKRVVVHEDGDETELATPTGATQT